MTTSFNTDPAPKLTPTLDGKKVVFSREPVEQPKTAEAEKPAEQPKQSSGKQPEKQ